MTAKLFNSANKRYGLKGRMMKAALMIGGLVGFAIGQPYDTFSAEGSYNDENSNSEENIDIEESKWAAPSGPVSAVQEHGCEIRSIKVCYIDKNDDKTIIGFEIGIRRLTGEDMCQTLS